MSPDGLLSAGVPQSPVPPTSNPLPPEPVGTQEVAARLGVQPRSMLKLRQRDRLPPPDYPSVNGTPAWEWRTILWWAGETGRLRTGQLRSAYTEAFGKRPPDFIAAGKLAS